MTSKNSAYKEKKTAVSSENNISLWQIIREDLRHRNWMIVLSSLVAFLTSPVAFVFCKAGAGSSHIVESEVEFYKILAQDLVDYFLGTHLVLQMMVIYVGAFIVAVFGFNYLFSKKMVDLYHSIPASRTKLFFAHYTSGFLVWFVPFLIGHLSVYIMALFTLGAPDYMGSLSAVAFAEILLLIICFLIVYNACLVPIMISGNIKNSILNILIYGFSVVLGYLAILFFMETYFDTYIGSLIPIGVPVITAFSPGFAPVFPALCFIDYMESGSISANPMSLLIATLICIFIMIAVNLFLSVVMYQKRPSELAERGVDNKWFRIPLRFVVSILAGLLLSLFFAGMAGKAEFGWALFGGIFGCIFSFCIMNILYHASFKALFSHKRQLLCSLIIVCVIIPVFHFDLLGYDTYLPNKDKIVGFSFYDGTLDGPGYALVKDENGYYTTTYSYTSVPENLVFTDAEANYELLKLLTDMEKAETIGYNPYQDRTTHNFTMRVDTTTGSYYRRYTFEHTDEIAELLEPYLNSKEFVEHYYPIGCGTMDAPALISVTSLDDFNVKITDSSVIKEIYNAYRQDFTKHYDWSDEFSTFYLFKMEFLYPSGNGFDDYCHVTLEIPSWYSDTIACLEKLYPPLTWSQDDLSFTGLNVAINSTYAGDEFSELQNYLGVGPSVNPLITTPLYDEKQCGHTWYREISDPAMVETLRPYLYLNKRRDYSSKNYVYIGEMTVVHPNLSLENSSTTYHCYMKRGEIPEGFAESLSLVTK